MRSGLGLNSDRPSNRLTVQRSNVTFNMPGFSSTAQLQQGAEKSERNELMEEAMVFATFQDCRQETGGGVTNLP